jgi:hypothetical protein
MSFLSVAGISARTLRANTKWTVVLLALLICAPSLLRAQDDDDFDAYKVRLSGFWFYSNPSGNFEASNASDTIDLQKDVGFNSYSTFSGKIDWKFTRKNHFYFVGSSFNQTRQVTLNRTITFQGQTFETGLSVKANLSSPLYAPGYSYDIFRRKRWHAGLALQIDLFDASASINAAAQVTGDGVHHAAVSAKSSLLAPIPVAGPDFRVYLTNSPRLYVDGNLFGMYLFGYGNFISTTDYLGVTIVKHVSANAGYQLGSRLVVNNNNSSNRIGIHLTQSGPIAGLQFSF